jgi:hypothetical protein
MAAANKAKLTSPSSSIGSTGTPAVKAPTTPTGTANLAPKTDITKQVKSP